MWDTDNHIETWNNMYEMRISLGEVITMKGGRIIKGVSLEGVNKICNCMEGRKLKD